MVFVFAGAGVSVVMLLLWAALPRATAVPRNVESRWARAAETLGLTYVPVGAKPRMEGKLSGFAVDIDTFERMHRGVHTQFTRVVVDTDGGIHPDILGEPAASGGGAVSLPAEDARRLAARLVERRGASITDGRITWAAPSILWKPEAFVDAVKGTVATAERLSVGQGDTARLLARGATDTNAPAATRRRMAMRMLDEFPNAVTTRALLPRLLNARDARLRYAAALAEGGNAGMETLRALMLAGGTASAVRRDALDRLSELPGGLTASLWHGLLVSGSSDMLRYAHDTLRKTHAKAGIDAALRVLARPEAPNALLLPLIETLGQLGVAAASGRLVDLLHEPDATVRRAAVKALGRVGGRDAERRLRNDDTGYLADPTTRQLCIDAVAAIQARAA